MEHQRQQLLQERQQFHLEQLRAAEFRQRQLAAQQLLTEGKLIVPTPTHQPVAETPQAQPMQANNVPSDDTQVPMESTVEALLEATSSRAPSSSLPTLAGSESIEQGPVPIQQYQVTKKRYSTHKTT